MRLSLSVNGAAPVVASLSGPGYLSARLNMSDRPKEDKHENSVRINGFETGETETVSVKWPTFQLAVGDVVELQILTDGEGHAPSEVRRSTESPYGLFSSIDLAKELIEAVSKFERHLMDLLDKAQEVEPADEHKKFALATAAVTWELGQHLLYPIYRKHRELIPEGMKGELL